MKIDSKMEQHRIIEGMFRSKYYSHDGCFIIEDGSRKLMVISSNGGEWEHVSVSKKDCCPTWDEMNYIKSMFFDDEECVVQFHPPKSKYKNIHPYCLHLWRHKIKSFPMPPIEYV